MKNVHKQIRNEALQTSATRSGLLRKVQRLLGERTLVAFFTSFQHPVSITDEDCDMLQDVFQSVDCSNGITLMISSAGGDGLAAERIVNACRAYSGTDDYWVLVPGKAKSAATVITMGASKVLMGPASELGAVDPQVIRREDGVTKVFSAHNLVSGYDRLFAQASATSGPIEPYIQQLAHYDDREITKYRSLMALSQDIAIKVLQSGQMAGMSKEDIEDSIEVFLNPEAGTLSHGRPIYADEAKECGMNVEVLDIHSEQWKAIYELYARIEHYVSSDAAKAVESSKESFYAQAP